MYVLLYTGSGHWRVLRRDDEDTSVHDVFALHGPEFDSKDDAAAFLRGLTR